jgi:NADH dehydrogenase
MLMWTDVLIVGGGFGGVTVAHRLERLLASRAERVLLVSTENFLTFTPLLPEAASGTLEPRHAVAALRQVLHRTDVLIGEVVGLDAAARRGSVIDLNGDRHDVAYRVLVFAPGSIPTTSPISGLLEHAVGFKTLPDAIWLRNRVLRQLEAADATVDLQRRREVLTFTFVGGGYAGVEALAELESLARDALAAYPSPRLGDFRWVLVEAADHVLPGLDSRLAAYTVDQLRRSGIEVHLGTRMVATEDGVITLSDPRIPPYRSETIVWTAGQRPNPLGVRAGLPVDERDRVVVDDHMRVIGVDDAFALGDVAAVPGPDGGTSPPTAQHTVRQARAAAANVAAVFGAAATRRVAHRTLGLAVTLGKHRGTAQVRRFVFTGWLAWWMGRTYHLVMLPGWGRRVRVVTDWTLALFFPRDISQLGALGPPSRLPDGLDREGSSRPSGLTEHPQRAVTISRLRVVGPSAQLED